jgi:L-arabinonolactonase
MYRPIDAELVTRCPAQVAESPVYDPDSRTLYWVDIPDGRLWRQRESEPPASRQVCRTLGCVALVEGGGFLLATDAGIDLLGSWGGVPWNWLEVERDQPTEFNDGKCDRRGRFIGGTAPVTQPGTGTLYRIGADASVTALFGQVGMSNGLDWTPDDQYFCHVDSIAGTVVRYHWDAAAGLPGDHSLFARVEPAAGLPDGLSIDAEGCLWLAIWGSGTVRRFAPDGQVIGEVRVPVPNVTSCTFGGDQLGTLYITTAAGGQPGSDLAGGVFAVDTGTQGQPLRRFARPEIMPGPLAGS